MFIRPAIAGFTDRAHANGTVVDDLSRAPSLGIPAKAYSEIRIFLRGQSEQDGSRQPLYLICRVSVHLGFAVPVPQRSASQFPGRDEHLAPRLFPRPSSLRISMNA